MNDRMIELFRASLWVLSVVLGSVGMFALFRSLVAPPAASYAIVLISAATAIVALSPES